jgi:pullulanase
MKKLSSLLALTGLAFMVAACAPDPATPVEVAEPETPSPQPTPVTSNEEGPTLVVHYRRLDNNYDGWNLWLWPNEPTPGDGDRYVFNDEDAYGQVMTVDLSTTNMADSTRIGIIVRTDNWDKDVSEDRFIDLVFDDNNEMHVYLMQSTSEIYFNESDVDTSDRIISANFVSGRVIEVRTTRPVEFDEDYQILVGGEPATIETIYPGGTARRIELSDDVDISKPVDAVVDFGEYTSTARVELSALFTTDRFNELYYYDGQLGMIYTPQATTFRLWAPVTTTAELVLYTAGHTSSQTDNQGNPGVDEPYQRLTMESIGQGVFEVIVEGDLHEVYYNFVVDGTEVVDPYVYTVGVNGQRGMVVDFDRTDPEGWQPGVRPELDNLVDTILYELHVRDLTSHESWNGPEDYRGTFLGLSHEGTTYNGVTTGFDYLKELGVTTVHLIPIFDHAIINETRLDDPTYYGIYDGIFNWGYMPHHFNALEGSYSTDPYNGAVRMMEFKQMVQAFHDAGIRVVMDVVYNHTGLSADSNFHQIFPGYYHRMIGDQFSNGSGTGNETASERAMVRKYIVDSVVFWAEEFKIDGFRFDLMRLHDVETMNQVRQALDEIDPSIIVYGEPWDAGGSQLNGAIAADKTNLYRMPNIAIFNDQTRDGLKGSVFNEKEAGYLQGITAYDSRIKLGIVAGSLHGGISSTESFTVNPNQIINYVTAHDNNTLWDKLQLTHPETPASVRELWQKQANAILLTSQGIPFIHNGVEMLRTKPCIDPVLGYCDATGTFDHNSYRAPDETNQIDWQWKIDNAAIVDYYEGLIDLRLANPAFRLQTSKEIQDHLFFVEGTERGLIQYILANNAGGNEYKHIMVIHNNNEAKEVELFGATWDVLVNRDQAGTTVLESISSLTIRGSETMVLVTNMDLPVTFGNGVVIE